MTLHFYLQNLSLKIDSRSIPRVHRIAMKSSRFRGEERRVAPVHFRTAKLKNLRVRQTSSIHLPVRFLPTACHVSRSPLAVSFVRSVEFRGLTSRRLSSPFGRTSIRCRADSMSMQSKRRPRCGCQLSVIYGPGPRTHP